MRLTDKYGRVHKYLRLSLTDKCNLRCIYCNPDSDSENCSNRDSYLTIEEYERLVRIFVLGFGFEKVRLTGGEPFARKNVTQLITRLGKIKEDKHFELTATTNGTLISSTLISLKAAGLDRLNFSLDSLDSDNFNNITGRTHLGKVLAAIEEAEDTGFSPIKINTVIMRGKNDHEILDFMKYAVKTRRNIRFIEYMPFSGNLYSDDMFMSAAEIKDEVKKQYKLHKIENSKSLVAKDFLIDGTKAAVSFISSISEHFCDGCDRLRITADGKMKTCLFSVDKSETDLRVLLRENKSDFEIMESIITSLQNKTKVHPDLHELKLFQNNDMLKIGG